jgi:hypothetical protein
VTARSATSPPKLGRPAGRLVMIVKSAHAHDPDLAYRREILAAP